MKASLSEIITAVAFLIAAITAAIYVRRSSSQARKDREAIDAILKRHEDKLLKKAKDQNKLRTNKLEKETKLVLVADNSKLADLVNETFKEEKDE